MRRQVSIEPDEKKESNVLEIKLSADNPADVELLTAILNAKTLEAKGIDCLGEFGFNSESDPCRVWKLTLRGEFPQNREYRYNYLAPDVE